MQTIKLQCHHQIPEVYFNQFNSVVRFAHNRMLENPLAKLSEIENLVKTKMQTDLDASFVKMAVNKAKSLPKKKIIFARKWFEKLKYGKTSKEEYLEAKNSSILLRGSKADSFGNRKAKLEIQDNQIIFKASRDEHYTIDLGNDRRLSQLKRLQMLCETGAACFTLEIRRNEICVVFDETILAKKPENPIKNRILAIDMNPNYIAVIIKNTENHEFHKEIIDLTTLNQITNKHKKLHETAAMANRIIKAAQHFQCSTIAFEELNMKSKDHGKGKKYNKLVNNSWNRARFIQILQKYCNLSSIKTYEIKAYYSSFVGCLTYPNEVDSIAAAHEIHRRAVDLQKDSTYSFFPKIEIKSLATRWKEMLGFEIDNFTWKELYDEFKKRKKLSYRNLFDKGKFLGFSFRLKSGTSGVICHEIPCFN